MSNYNETRDDPYDDPEGWTLTPERKPTMSTTDSVQEIIDTADVECREIPDQHTTYAEEVTR